MFVRYHSKIKKRHYTRIVQLIQFVFVLFFIAAEELSTGEFSGSSTFVIKAKLIGGRGDCAWQHAQLFRQNTNDKNIYPFQVKITFKNM